MNVNDFENTEGVPKDVWKAIFNKQRELAVKYKDIEGMGTLLDETHKNIQTSFGQRWIKDFAWRVTEEIAEALEAKRIAANYLSGEVKEQAELHYLEEMIDALHFLTELTIIAGYDEHIFTETVLPSMDGKDEWETIYYLGIMCNTLKNKPWKQTQMLTDKTKFEKYLQTAWGYFIATLFVNGLHDVEDIYNLYFKKNQVNQFRIRSKY